jgi:hypothetical protein
VGDQGDAFTINQWRKCPYNTLTQPKRQLQGKRNQVPARNPFPLTTAAFQATIGGNPTGIARAGESRMLVTHDSTQEEEVPPEKLWQALGPHHVDQTIRQAISTCWMMPPQEKKSVAGLEAEIRRVVERALKNLREDAAAFGIPIDHQPAQK